MFGPASSAVVQGVRHRARAHGGWPEVCMQLGIAIALFSAVIIGASDAETHASGAVHPPTGYHSITTNPAVAAVYRDDQHGGASPVQLLTVVAGQHLIRIV